MISIIVAIADNNAIGRNNQLLWHISEDLRYFKRITGGHTIIMGRKTWESIGKALPNRRNIVISRTLKSNESIEVYSSIEDALSASGQLEEEVFIIGGGELYKEMLPYADRLYITYVHTSVDNADTFFPVLDLSVWKEISRESYSSGEKFGHPFEFVVFDRAH